MDKDSLRRLQLTQLEMLKDIKKVCDKHGIRYFLSSGTLLGAVRHKGFIPWDDDLDLDMFRSDYEKFLNIAQKELGKQYFVQDWDTDNCYGFPFAKVLKEGTMLQEAVTEGTGVRDGIFIDIFPLDFCGDKLKMKKEMRAYLFWTKILLMKSGYKIWKATGAKNRKWKYIPYIILGKFFSRKELKKQIMSISKKWNKKYRNSGYCTESVGYNFLHLIIRSKSMETSTDLFFEDDYFRAPGDYDMYLSDMYGDYMTLPPLEQRENRHNILKLQF